MNIFLEKKETLGLSYSDICAGVGFDRNYIHGVLNGNKPMSLDCFIKLSVYFNLDVDEAIAEREAMETNRLRKSLSADREKIQQAIEKSKKGLPQKRLRE